MIKSKYLWISTLLLLLVIISLNFTIMPEQKPALHYLVRHPKIQSQKPPLVILMHGVGGNEQNMFSLANTLPDNFLVVSARGPIMLGANSFAWFQVQFTAAGSVINEAQAESSRKEILKFIEDLKKVENFDENQVYLMGFSQGGIMSYSVALTEPEKIAGIAVMSGRLLPEIKPFIADKSRLKKLKIFISHGTHDSVLKFQYALDAQEYLKSKEINPDFHQYTEDHTINPAMLIDVVNWISK